jgi:hypothetical protein
MEHLLLKATTTSGQDLGIFEAVIGSAAVDRERDVVSAQGMVDAIQRWIPTGKNLPLTWHHSTSPDMQIGYVDPSTARVVGDEVVASGWIDQSIPAGKDAWRLVRMGTLGFSFGYLTTKANPRAGGGRDLLEMDIFECTATAIPMQHNTRILGHKAMTAEELREAADAIAEGREAEMVVEQDDQVPEFEPDPEPEPEPTPREDQRRQAVQYARESAAEMRELEQEGLPDPQVEPEPEPAEPRRPAPADALRRRAELTEAETALSAREDEERALPTVQPIPAPPAAPDEPTGPVPSAREQRERAEMFEWELAREVRAQDDRRVPARPDVPDEEPTAEPESVVVPDARAQRREAVAVAGETAKALRRQEERQLPDPEVVEPEPEPESPKPPDAKALQRRIQKAERLGRQIAREEDDERIPDLETKVTPEPFSTSRTSNWVARAGGLPPYIQHIAHDLVDERGMTESQAIATAISICKRWAAGGGGVSADTKAKAAAAVAEWERMKASHGKAVFTEAANPGAVCETLYGRRIGKVTHGHKAIDPAGQRAYADELEREQDGTALLRIGREEMDGLAMGELKAVWSTAYEKTLPDSCFLYIEPGGSKDQDGKTVPRSLRHLPYKDDNGSIDLPHLRNALARIPGATFLTAEQKAQLTKRAQAILDKQGKAVVDREQKLLEAEDILARKAEETNRAPQGRFVDPLRERAKAVELEFTSGGESERKPPPPQPVPTPRVPELSLDALQRKARDEMLVALSGVDDP